MAESALLEKYVSILEKQIKGAIESRGSIKTISPGKKRHPWFNTEHHSMVQERNNLYKRFRKTRLLLDLLAYRQVRVVAHRIR